MATILVVDDRAINRTFLATLLESVDHLVLQAPDGMQALEILRRERPDLVISDVLMPVMGGIEFANHVHADPKITHTPIIFYTATYRVTEARELANTCHVSTVLAKPAEPDVILNAVDAALGLQASPRARSSAIVAPTGGLNASPLYADVMASTDQALHLRLATLLELHLALSSERDPTKVLSMFCRASQDILNCKYVVVGILNSSGLAIEMLEGLGLGNELRDQFASIDPRAGILGRIIASGKPIRATNSSDSPSTLGLPDFHSPVSSLLAVPMPVRSSVPLEGWVYFAERFGSDSFSSEDEQIAVVLAAQLAQTYGNLTQYDEIQRHAVSLEIEVAQRTRAQNELAHRMTHDQVTELPRVQLLNTYLQATLKRVAQGIGQVMLFYIDIDRIQMINATRGRVAGDVVLRAVANRLKAVGGEQGWVAHVAGDEFAMAIVDADRTQNPLEVAESMRKHLEVPIQHNGERLHVTCSVGVSWFPENAADFNELFEQAEDAMLHAKREGRNAAHAFSNTKKSQLKERTEVGRRLGDAIRQGQLLLHYQPKISAQNWRTVGFEGLVRWQSAEFGLLLPDRFLPVAEDLGLIVDIGSYVLESVCRQARAWLDMGATDFSIAMNVSALQLQRQGFTAEVSAALNGWDLPAKHIELELTEDMMTGNVDRVIATMNTLKALGVKISLDDFGTGYSSLNYLSQFPIDTLKIDKSFVNNIASSAAAAGICRAIVTLGHQLGMAVLAEGVETPAQVGYLRRNGCDLFQGFYFGRPVPASQAFEFLLQRQVSHEGLEDQLETLTLLLVDDDENVLHALSRALRREDYRILMAANSEDALEILARDDVQVILADQRMKGNGGTQFLVNVREMYPDTIRMVLSGYTELSVVTAAINQGEVYKFLTKPWDDVELRMEITGAFRTYEARRERSLRGSAR